ncbi:hypothetical protein V496_05980 [Pseudogymnoascus sp. VKM F-4515 (FW-2607)]|nr:hypothetical protein V496_05980 [Pseudogymnoascus sp. VKM F-4515 (FW-2607)]
MRSLVVVEQKASGPEAAAGSRSVVEQDKVSELEVTFLNSMHPLIVACLSSPNYPPEAPLHSHLPKCIHITQAPTSIPIPLPKESQIYLISPQSVTVTLIDPPRPAGKSTGLLR